MHRADDEEARTRSKSWHRFQRVGQGYHHHELARVRSAALAAVQEGRDAVMHQAGASKCQRKTWTISSIGPTVSPHANRKFGDANQLGRLVQLSLEADPHAEPQHAHSVSRFFYRNKKRDSRLEGTGTVRIVTFRFF